MKAKSLLLLLATACISQIQSIAQNVPNYGFESWSLVNLFEDLDGYRTSNAEAYRHLDGMSNLTKVTGAEGQFAAQMQTIGEGENATFGYFINGNADGDDSSGGPMFTGGQPYTGKPDSISFTCKYDIKPGDSALLIVIFKKNGVDLSSNFFFFDGSQNSFAKKSFKLPALVSDPDTVFLGMVTSNPFGNPKNGSTVTVDDLHFVGGTGSINNGDFESWSLKSVEEPKDWYTNNIRSVEGEPLTATKTTDKYSGSYALRLESYVETDGNNSYSQGRVSTGNYNDNTGQQEGGFPYNTTPTKLTGYYKYIPNGTDSANISVSFYKYNTTTKQRDNLGGGGFTLSAATNYTPFEFNVFSNMTPDTADITIESSNNNSPKNGSVLFIDDLNLGEFLGVRDQRSDNDELTIYSNPDKNMLAVYLYLQVERRIQLQIYDVLGKVWGSYEWARVPAGNHVINLDSFGLSHGLYTYRCLIDNAPTAGKMLINR